MLQASLKQFSASVTVLLIFAMAACSSPGRWHGTDPTVPSPSATATVRTIADSEVGDRITVTAVLVTVISERSFVVEDVDLPNRGLLTLGHLPEHSGQGDLLTMRGVIATFDFDRLAWTYGLVRDSRYEKFQDHKILIAQDVRSWA
ncbi:hypothetical protein AB0C12_12780 [Actinoplanes sp. NPDC048967]|uniref:hypothetical protein n=1 Tax=Actinoplanes sp. NPDC048967 TaxID=3155269 RepID=UPI0033D98045